MCCISIRVHVGVTIRNDGDIGSVEPLAALRVSAAAASAQRDEGFVYRFGYIDLSSGDPIEHVLTEDQASPVADSACLSV